MFLNVLLVHYVWPPLMDEAACFMRKRFVFWVGDCCKLLWGMGLKNFGFLCHSRIVQTESIRNWVEGAGGNGNV